MDNIKIKLELRPQHKVETIYLISGPCASGKSTTARLLQTGLDSHTTVPVFDEVLEAPTYRRQINNALQRYKTIIIVTNASGIIMDLFQLKITLFHINLMCYPPSTDTLPLFNDRAESGELKL